MKGKKFSEEVRIFCLRQQYCSNAAYESLRTYFNKNLPSKRSLQYWYSSIDGEPGINKSALEVIREKAETYQAKENHQLHLTLISDEMWIRKDPCWRGEKKEFVGCSSVTNTSQSVEETESEPLKSAKEALVFLVVGPDFKIPIAYHLLNGLESIDRAILTREAIRYVEGCDVRVISLTSDGLRANVTTAELLGADFVEGKTSFASPTYPEQCIYVIFDPPHMLKLVRKHFSSGNLYSPKGLIDWNLLRILVERQSSENFNLCNRLTQHHIDWHQKPMNVKLAAQVLSKSCADALEQLQEDGYDEFQNSAATIEFLRNFNDLFDILNFAQGRQSNHLYKQAISNETVEKKFPFLNAMKKYIESIEIEEEGKKKIIRKPIFKSKAQMGFFGFYTDILSLIGIYDDFVKNGPLETFYPMQFSQDHLETLFSLIRNSVGRNDNPNATEFASAIRKLLVCHPLTTSKDHNVITNATGILTVPVRAKKKQQQTTIQAETEVIDINYTEALSIETESMQEFDKHVCANVALCIEKRIVRQINAAHKSRCQDCAKILYENAKIDDALLAKKNADEHQQPNESTVEIVIFSNRVIKMFPRNGVPFNQIEKTISKNLDFDKLYGASSFNHGEQNHKEEFLANVVTTYLIMKSERIGKLIGDEERGAFIRSRLKNSVQRAGQ